MLGKFYDGLKLLDENKDILMEVDVYQSIEEIELGYKA